MRIKSFCEKNKIKAAVLSMLLLSCFSIKVKAESWLYDSGKWYYYETYDEPVENQWITYNGNEYYIGSKGLMAADKWVVDELTGKKVYLGINGVKQKNAYTYKRDKFVGEDGTELVAFNNWRKEAKKSLQKTITALNKKTNVTSDQKAILSQLSAKDAGFSLYDVNSDGFRDIVVVNRFADSEQVLEVLLWNEEEQKFQSVMELDYTSDESAVLRKEQSGKVWLIISKDINDVAFFELDINDENFKDVEHFHYGYNDYGDIIYYVDDDEVTASVWNTSLLRREQETGSGIWTIYHDLDENSINAEVDTYPTESEIALFSTYDKDD